MVAATTIRSGESRAHAGWDFAVLLASNAARLDRFRTPVRSRSGPTQAAQYNVIVDVRPRSYFFVINQDHSSIAHGAGWFFGEEGALLLGCQRLLKDPCSVCSGSRYAPRTPLRAPGRIRGDGSWRAAGEAPYLATGRDAGHHAAAAGGCGSRRWKDLCAEAQPEQRAAHARQGDSKRRQSLAEGLRRAEKNCQAQIRSQRALKGTLPAAAQRSGLATKFSFFTEINSLRPSLTLCVRPILLV